MDEMGRFAFWSLYAETGVMRVYNVDGDGHVSSCLGSLSEKIKIILWGNGCGVCFSCSFVCVNLLFLAFCGGLTDNVLICYSLLVSF
jgi:hypothetical protein